MPKASEVFGRTPRAISVDDARKAMIDAGEAPAPGILEREKQRRGIGGNTPVVQEITTPVVEPIQAAPAVPVQAEPVAPLPVQPEVERVENEKFMAEIRQENGGWVAQIYYKNGAGTERFTATSRNDLMLKLLEGKGNATLRVREAVRREKLLGPQLELGVLVPPGMSLEDFQSLPEATRKSHTLTLETQQAINFRDKHPEYYNTNDNRDAILEYLEKRKAPITVNNLEIAYKDLLDSNLLETKAEPIPVTITAPAPAPIPVDSGTAPTATPTVSTVPAPAAVSAEVVRPRGTTGLQPKHSTSVEETVVTPKEPSVKELRALPISELKRIAEADRLRWRAERR